MKELVEKCRKEEQELQEKLDCIRKRKNRYPTGQMKISHSNGCVQYYFRKNDEKDYHYGKDKTFAAGIAQRDYDRRLEKELKQRLCAVRKVLNAYGSTDPENLIKRICSGRRELIVPLYCTDEEFVRSWQEEEYSGKPFAENETEILTVRGERVRSKSEKIIADTLFHYKIPYKYECPLILTEQLTVYPDFKVLNTGSRKEYIWEHLGMMDQESYSAGTVIKMNSYLKSGFYPGENMIITAESARVPLGTRVIEWMIEKYLV